MQRGQLLVRPSFVRVLHALPQCKFLSRKMPPYGTGKDEYWFQCYQRAFKCYTKLWANQQEFRTVLVEHAGLQRWEIGKMASRIGQLYYHYYIRTSSRKYLEEAASFYEAIQERDYFSLKSNPGVDAKFLEDKQHHFRKRYILINVFLGRFERALIVSMRDSDVQMHKLTQELVSQAPQHFVFQNLETSIDHVIILTGSEISLQYCWLHLLVDSCKRLNGTSPIKTTLQNVSFASTMAAISLRLSENGNLLILECPSEIESLRPEDLAPFIKRGYHVSFLNFASESIQVKCMAHPDDQLVKYILNTQPKM